MENELELKWRRIQQAMRQEEADGCLLTMNVNLYYVSGQVFNGYFYLPAEGRPYWFVKRLTVPETNQVHVIRKPEQMPELFRDLNLAMPRKLLLERTSFLIMNVSVCNMYSGLKQRVTLLP